jgi:hypothetical protein
MDLQALRDYATNVLDYDATANPTFRTQLDKLLTDAYERVWSEKPWQFAQRDILQVARPDAAATIGATAGSPNLTHTGALLVGVMDGQVIEIGGVEYTIAYVRSGTLAYLTEPFRGTTGSYAATVIYRYIDLPADTQMVMNVAHRTNSITPEDPGMMVALTRYEDEYYNLALGERGVPRYWVPQDPVTIPAPLIPAGVATVVAAPGRGVRTIEIAMANEWAGRSSGLSQVTTLSLTDTQEVTLTPAVIPNSTGLYRVYYLRSPDLGLHAWRKITDTAGVTSVAPNGGVTLTPDTSTTFLTSQAYALNYPRYQGDGGMRERYRLYPRQAEEQNYTVRYLARPRPLVEATDTPDIPAAHRVVIAYRALVQLLMKSDNAAESALYEKRSDNEILKMERRYLIDAARRIVIGNFSTAGAQRFNRFGPLKQVP